MTDEGKKRIREETEETEEDIRKLDAESEERRVMLDAQLDEDMRVRSKMMEREILESSEQAVSGDGPDKDDSDPQRWRKHRRSKRKKTRWDGLDEEEAVERNIFADSFFPSIAPPSAVSLASMSSSHMPSTGRRPPLHKIRPIATTPFGLVREAMIRRWDAQLKQKGEQEGVTLKDLYKRMWLVSGMEKSIEERQVENLHQLEDSSDQRTDRIRELASHAQDLSAKERKELSRLYQDEAQRFMLREKLVDRSINDQDRMTWLRPMGGGAMSAMPFTFVSTYDLLSNSDRKVVRWYYDNMVLRWQHALVSRFLPKKPKFAWFRKELRGQFESLFQDVDEEIFAEKKMEEEVKKREKELEDYEEELRGYDNLTVEEEKKVSKMFQEEIKRLEELAKEEEYY
ncbi:MAG: hypothetical protein GF416_04115 [Candidatus Altiarchaeales archaeon]|nr:hypothetical protein [Candidatus Altiarchaeales archaeon]MBD3416305.1 hypothetical protein [Candidatus Altiarchaeales archaeon]